VEQDKKKRAQKWSLGIGSGIGTLMAALAEPEAAKQVLDIAWHAWLTQCLIAVTVIWFFMGKKVRVGVQQIVDKALAQFNDHFDRMEQSVNGVAQNLTKLEHTVSQGLKNHSEKLDNHGEKLDNLDHRVQVLENKNSKEG
jgi:hypothetical protein